ncbi:MAG: hypothetical protein F4Z01_10365 [Gammaproteobacteria bacterium]|nr:hypothetical protein [Gammaproteobacteria bacterium]
MVKENTTSHAFFFTVIFMTSVVVITIVGYFIFLPKTAPKLITVAVLPFDAPEEFPTHLTSSFPEHITELVAASRDVYVVDYAAAEEAVALEHRSRGFRNELGTTHIVDGSFEVSVEQQDAWILKMRLIDVSKDVWKLKWEEKFAHPELSVLEIRNLIVINVAEKLYDNTIPDPSSDGLDSVTLEQYLLALAEYREYSSLEPAMKLVYRKEHASPYMSELLKKMLPDAPMSWRKEWVELALSNNSNYYSTQVTQAQLKYEERKNLVTYLREMTFLAGQFPNSSAVGELAILYFDLGWFEDAQDLLLRWAQIRPRSSKPALAIAFNRFRRDDLKGVEEALEIARLRDKDNKLVDRYRALYEWKVKGKELNTEDLDYLIWIERFENKDFSPSDPEWNSYVEDLSCFDQVELSLYLNIHDYIFDSIDCNDNRLWLQPPPWWAEDDPKWIAFREDSRYVGWIETKGVRSDVLKVLEPVNVKELFAPRRKVLNSDGG